MNGLDIFLDAFFNQKVIDKYLPDILWGMVVTVQVALAVVATGIVLGLGLAAIRSFHIRPVNWLIVGFVDIFPVLWLVLSLVLAAFSEEIFWAGIASIRKGQWEAARSTGLTLAQTLGYIILPQAVRITVPPLTNRTIAITKNTALGAVIGVPEILMQAQTAQSFSGNATPLLLGSLAYVALFVPVVILGRWLETRFAWDRA